MCNDKLGESDGRCVRTSEPISAEHSIFHLLLNPPSDERFQCIVRIRYVSECSPFLPLSYATPRPDVLGDANSAYYLTFTG